MLIKKIFTCLIIVFAVCSAAKAQNIIRTVTDFATAGGRAESIATDASGNVYFVDRYNNKVRKYDLTTKTVSTIIATGLTAPRGIAFDENGDFYLSDQHKITKYNSAGTLQGVVAGTGTSGYFGDGGAATLGLLFNPYGLAYDKVNKILYIAENGNAIIRKINFNVVAPAVPQISTFAGTQNIGTFGPSLDAASATNTKFRQPAAVTLDADGNVYWAGSLNSVVWKSNLAGTAVSIIVSNTFYTAGNTGDGGLATAAKIGSIGSGGLAFDPTGNLYVSDNTNSRVRRVLKTTGTGVFGNIENYAGFNNFVSGSTTLVSGGGEGADPNVTTGNSTIMNAPNGIAFNPAGTILYIAEGGTINSVNLAVIRAVGTAAVLSTTLPLDLISFDVKTNKETAILQWTTENEVNFKEFIVERKGDTDANFTPLKSLPTKNLKGTTNYSFTDFGPLKGNNYYQLKMVDNDGTFKMSEVKVAKFASLNNNQIGIYPNPVQSSLNLNHPEANFDAIISIYAMDGKLITEKSVVKNSTQTILDASSLKEGQYILEYKNNGNKQVVKFIK